MISRRSLLLGATALPIATLARAGDAPVFQARGAAINGYDPVAYFTDGRAVKGSSAITHSWTGAEWRFATEANRAAFVSAPERYAPQFGGYCAWAVSNGYTASTDPDAWKIVDGRLYLNYSRRVQRRWERDIPGNIARGNANWPSVLG